MLTFDSALSITLCSRQGEARINRWANVFGRLFGCFSRQDGIGGWVGPKVVETENNATISVWISSDAWQLVKRTLKYAQWYQAIEGQEAVAIQITWQSRWQSYVLFDQADWDKLSCELRRQFDLSGWEEYQVEKLIAEFESASK